MPSRYYFLSSLPMLRFTDSAPLTWERFMSEALGNVSDSDYSLLTLIPEGKDGGNAFLKKCFAMDASLNAAVCARRKQLLGREDNGGMVLREVEVERVANEAMNAKNPLEAELLLMKFRFNYLEEIKGLEPFTQSALLAYALQLRMLLRKDSFTVEHGNAEFTKLFDQLQKELNME